MNPMREPVIVNGLTRMMIAKELGVSRETARTYLEKGMIVWVGGKPTVERPRRGRPRSSSASDLLPKRFSILKKMGHNTYQDLSGWSLEDFKKVKGIGGRKSWLLWVEVERWKKEQKV